MTLVSAISCIAPANGFRSSTARSARLPTAIVPASSSWFTYALPRVNAASAVCERRSAATGRGPPRRAVPDDLTRHGDLDLEPGVGVVTGQSLPNGEHRAVRADRRRSGTGGRPAPPPAAPSASRSRGRARPRTAGCSRRRRAPAGAGRRRGRAAGGARRGGVRRCRPLASRAASHRVECAPERAVPERVLVHLEARVRRAGPPSRSSASGFDELDTVPCASPNAPSYGASIDAVQLSGQPSSMIFTVLASTLAAGRPSPLLDELVDLLGPAVPVPPQRGHDAHRELAGVVQARDRPRGARARPRRPATR